MRARWLWAALTAASASASLLSLGACGEVESCKEDEPGCLGNGPDDSGNCLFGLVVGPGGTCVEQGAKPTPNPCGCGANELCRDDNTCINVCSAPDTRPAAKPVPKTCTAVAGEAAYDFAKAAVAFCYQAGIHRAELCPAGVAFDPAQECTVVRATALLATLGCTDLACATTRCMQARDTLCPAQQCAGGAAPNCAGVVCDNRCANPEFNNDGICDDGDLSNADSAVCAWGQDCGDCGPRRGTAPVFERDLGEPCIDPLQCGGDALSIASSTGWCVPTNPNTNLYRCVPDCSQSGDTCPSGYECVGLGSDPDGLGPMPQVPVVDRTGAEASACFPMMCGD